jgi:HSP20 family protein
MSLVRRTSPFGELLSLRQAMDRLFEDSFVRSPAYLAGAQQPLALDVYMTDDALIVEAALPGFTPEDVEIAVLGDTLTISATSHAEEKRDEQDFAYREIRRGSVSRTVTLPAGVDADDATASYDNGMLRLTLPKAEQAKPRHIAVQAGGGDGHATKIDAGNSGDTPEQER